MSTVIEEATALLKADHYLGGARVSGEGEALEIISPATGQLIGQVPMADPAFVDQVVANSQQAFEQWSLVPVKDRAQVLFRFKHLVESQINDLAKLVSEENGKTVAEAKAGIQKGLEVVEYATSVPNLITGENLDVSRGVECRSKRYPLGVVAGITPFNFPAMVPMWMFPIAIVCGNAFVLKPSEQVPLTSVRIAELLSEAGLPEGVFNVVQGNRATVEAILDHPGIAAAGFVGSTPVARAVYQRGTNNGKRMLTLGGAKNHLVVVPDADPAIAARNITSSVTGCAGQRCMAASVLITVGDCEHVMSALREEMGKVKAGENMGAIISKAARDRITGYIDQAEQEGATIAVDGRNAQVEGCQEGYYVNPTIIDGVTTEHACVTDEIFGPVVSVLHVDTLDEALAIENSNPYGNAAAIYTSSGATARYFEAKASAGMIGINIGVPVPREPFAFGGWNDSRFGVGDITGKDAISFWTKSKKITEKWTASAANNWMS